MRACDHRRAVILACLVACLSSCSSGDVEPATSKDGVLDKTITLAPPKSGYQLVTKPYVVPPTSEVEICTVVKVLPKDGEKFAWVHRFESLVSEGSHHMNVFIGNWSFLDGYLGDGAAEKALGIQEGQYPCAELKVMESAFPVFPSQRQNQHIVMPKGVGIPMPMPLLLVASHHYLNTSQRPVRINAMVNVQTVPASEVQQVAGIVFDGAGVDVPPQTRKVSQKTCIFERDTQIALVSTHNHQRTECATLHHFDPTEGIDSKPFYANHNWDQPPIVHFKPGRFAVKKKADGDKVPWPKKQPAGQNPAFSTRTYAQSAQKNERPQCAASPSKWASARPCRR